MSVDPITLGFSPKSLHLDLATKAEIGIRTGDSGPHTSRTIMLSELNMLFEAAPLNTTRETYRELITENNSLAKRTASTRNSTFQRLSELYTLDETVLIFRLFRKIWDLSSSGRPLLALVAALSRDPILRVTAPTIIRMKAGEELSRQEMLDAISAFANGRLNETVIQAVLRNTASSWTQSGHLIGRSRKTRKMVEPNPYVVTYALLLGYILGARGSNLYKTIWAKVLDSTEGQLIDLSQDAKRLGLIDMRNSGGVVEVSPTRLLTEDERRLIHGTN